ncbi:SWIM zinc finger family protein [Pseudonocardia sp. S2-4]|uniref:SWIM zinc finger family protein n=1 Tax=Pseudonocardia humida TaxID=2800819 RepID=A0ABT1A419_9PSEU|nr:SWIM zinc finger family protein [Pseudonocardia humida]
MLALAPDAGSARGARAVAGAGSWDGGGVSGELLWGSCRGSGTRPYQACVDLSGPAYRCSCPSRKFPCKHALGLMLRWATGEVEEAQAPAWVREWQQAREARASRAAARPADEAAPSGPVDVAAAERRAAQRAERVAGGVAELDRWLLDQLTHGLAAVEPAGDGPFEAMAARLVDAQAPGLAEAVRRAGRAVGVGPRWAERLLARLAALRLLVTGHARLAELPDGLAATVRSRIGFPVSTEQVLAGPPVRDRWQVVGQSHSADERLLTRRTWLLGAAGGRPALVLAFAPLGRSLPPEAPPGTAFEADLCFYPGAAPVRAVVAARHGEPAPIDAPAGARSVREALAGVAALRAADPWLGDVPVLLRDVRPAGTDRLVDADRDALDLRPGPEPPWWLLAVSGGAPLTVAGELGASGLRVLSAWPSGPGERFAAAPPGADDPAADGEARAHPQLPADLVSAALVGTGRRPWGGGPVAVGGRELTVAGGATGAAALLDAAAVAVAYRQSGPVPVAGAVADEPAGPETRPVVPPAAAARLDRLLRGTGVPGGPGTATDLLDGWLRAAAERGFRVPADALPALLDRGHRHTALRPAVALLAGRRGAWLAERRPEWAYLRVESADAAQPRPDDWETGTPGERVAFLTALRRRDPAAGLDLLTATFDAEAPDDRARLLRALAEGLGPADEPLLERALRDRRAEVRAGAAELLAALPGSRLTARMAARATAAVRVEHRALGRDRWVVDPPAEFDPGLRRDGVTPPARGTDARAELLVEVVARTPLSTWTALADRSPAQVLAMPVTEAWAPALRRGLTRAAVAAGDAEWAQALAGTAERGRPVGPDDDLVTLAARGLLPAEWVATHLVPALARDPGVARRVLAGVPTPWPEPVARAVYAAVEAVARAGTFSWQLRELCALAATGMPVAWAPPLARLAEGLTARAPDKRAGALVTTLAAALTFRHDMTEELR